MGIPVSIELTPTFHNIGVVVPYSGPTPAFASLEWKRTVDTVWKPGARVLIDGLAAEAPYHSGYLECRGSILKTLDNTGYDVRMTVDGQTIGGSVTTLEDVPPPSTGPARYLSDDGSDSNPGTIDAPWGTYRHALGALGGGEILYIRGHLVDPPMPNQARLPEAKSGTPDNWTLITNWPGYEASVDFCYPEYHYGTGLWEHVSGYIWRCPIEPANRRVSEGEYLLHPYISLADLQNHIYKPPGGCYIDWVANYTYVWLTDNGNPNGREMNLAHTSEGNMRLTDKLHVRFSGVTLRIGHEMFRVRDSSFVMIDNNKIRCSKTTMRVLGNCNRIREEDNKSLQNINPATWDWGRVKSWHEGALWDGEGVSGRQNVVRRNKVVGSCDCVCLSSYVNVDDPNMNNDLDIYDNTFRDTLADPTEFEGACINVRYYNNKTGRSRMGTAPSPIRMGPVYHWNNVMVDFWDAGVKSGRLSRNFWCWNDTWYSTWIHPGELAGPVGLSNFAGGGGSFGHKYINCIMRTYRYVAVGNLEREPTNELDYNIYWNSVGNLTNNYPTLAAAQAAGFMGAHSMQVDPALDRERRPFFNSPAVDAALLMGGMNDQDFIGDGPDIGALEYNGIPSQPIADFLDPVPNVGDSPLSVQFDSSGSQGEITDFLWVFGDGEISTAEHPVHTYVNATGETVLFWPELTVSGPGGSDTRVSPLPVTVHPQATPVPCDLTIAIEGEGSTVPPPGVHDYMSGDEVTVEAEPAAGWRFVGWEGTLASSESVFTFTIGSDTSLTAVFEEITYNLEIGVQGQGTTIPAVGTIPVAPGDIVELHATPATGWEFDHWTGNVAESQLADTSITVNQDEIVNAVFIEITHELVISATTGGTTNPVPDTYTYPHNAEITVTAIPAAGYYLNYWLLNGDIRTANPLPLIVDGDGTLEAIFEEVGQIPDQYTLTITAGPGGTTEPVPDAYLKDEGSEVIIKAVPATGYRFNHWEGDIEGTEPTVSFAVNSDMSIVAIFSEIPEVGGGSVFIVAATCALLTTIAAVGILIGTVKGKGQT